MLLDASESVVLVVDMQPAFLNPIHRGEAVLDRCRFLVQAARLLEVPVLATEQYPSRMGGTEESLAALLDGPVHPKMAFSCLGSSDLVDELEKLKRSQVILCGIETHICVCQTAHDLADEDYDVFLAADAISARTEAMHEAAMARLKELGCTLVHTESALYEWMQSAEHPAFKQALSLVKAHPAP